MFATPQGENVGLRRECSCSGLWSRGNNCSGSELPCTTLGLLPEPSVASDTKSSYPLAMLPLPNMLQPDALKRLSRDLANEEILWSGQPSPWSAFWRSAPIWLLGIPWTAFCLAWEGIALAALFSGDAGQRPDGAGLVLVWVFPIFGLPFVLIGARMVVQPFLAARDAGRTVHVLTETRIVTAQLGKTLSVSSILHSRIFEITKHVRPDGSGNLRVSLGFRRDSEGDRVESTETLHGVPDIEHLDRELRRLMARAA